MSKPYYEHGGIVIYHGDCREVLPTLTEKVDLVLTDPPYGDNHDTDYTRFTGQTTEALDWGASIVGDSEAFNPESLLTIGARQVIFGANRFSNHLPVGSWLVWDKRKENGVKGALSDGEPAWYSQGRGLYIYTHMWDGYNKASEKATHFHPTQKPVSLMLWCLKKAKATGLVLDPYMGSGPVLVAAKQVGLPAIGIEIEERYCEIAAKRLAQEVMPFTTQTTICTNESTGVLV